jgi:capsular polysaccharide biosynthesis protein
MAQSSSGKKINTRAVSMDVLSLLRLLARHWRVTAPAALLTLVGLVAVFKVSSPTYNATGSILLLNPREAPSLEDPAAQAASKVGQNAFTRYGDIAIVTDILTRSMNSDSKREELAQHGVGDYSIVTSQFQRDPVFEITGQGPDAASAMRSTDIVLEEASKVLAELQVQQGADPAYLISSTPLEAPSTATAMYGSTMRAAIAVVAVGALGTLGLAVLAEIIGQRRAASRSAPRSRVDAGADEADAVEDDSDDEVVVEATGSNGSARRDADADDDSEAEVVVEATGSNGSARRDADADSEAEVVVEVTGSNGSARRDADADADSEAEVAAATSARSRTAGRGLGMPASSRSFNSARIVPDGSPRAAREGRNGSPAWGRATAPLGRRPHRRQSQAEGSNGSPPDDQRDRSEPDR